MENRIAVDYEEILSSTLTSMLNDIENFKNNVDQIQKNTFSTLGVSWVGKDADELSKTINTINNELKSKTNQIAVSTRSIETYVSYVKDATNSQSRKVQDLYHW